MSDPAAPKPADFYPAARKAVTKVIGRDARVAKVAGFTFDQVQQALREAVEELYPDVDPEARWDKGPWVRDVYDDVVIYCWEGQIFSVPYTFGDGTATLSGTPTAVKVVYEPIGGAAAGSASNTGAQATPAASAPAAEGGQPATPSAEAGKRAIESALFTQAAKGADEALAKLSKRATPAAPPVVHWPGDLSKSGKRNVVAQKG